MNTRNKIEKHFKNSLSVDLPHDNTGIASSCGEQVFTIIGTNHVGNLQ
jgi:hypothetical protein